MKTLERSLGKSCLTNRSPQRHRHWRSSPEPRNKKKQCVRGPRHQPGPLPHTSEGSMTQTGAHELKSHPRLWNAVSPTFRTKHPKTWQGQHYRHYRRPHRTQSPTSVSLLFDGSRPAKRFLPPCGSSFFPHGSLIQDSNSRAFTVRVRWTDVTLRLPLAPELPEHRPVIESGAGPAGALAKARDMSRRPPTIGTTSCN